MLEAPHADRVHQRRAQAAPSPRRMGLDMLEAAEGAVADQAAVGGQHAIAPQTEPLAIAGGVHARERDHLALAKDAIAARLVAARVAALQVDECRRLALEPRW